MAAALGIVRSHGGGIAVESAPGRGPPADEPLTVAEAVTEAARGEGIILVAEDEAGIRSLVQRTLEGLGYTVLLAEHGGQALEIFERVGGELILALLDLAGEKRSRTAKALQPGARICLW